ncbi:MAG: 4Fe-4S dicluster domain-containing protein, partial [Candidatus Aminicenantes bacterium]|nr:4Fe-4S dicluster domain-containing protein [Candidatus Aminicenantes bacterium]
EDEAIKLIKDSINKTDEKTGEKIVTMNWDAVDRTSAALQQIEVPSTVQEIKGSAPVPKLIADSAPEFARSVIEKMMHLQGDSIPVSQMPLDGKVPTATAKLEKRGIAPQVPRWLSENCIQCNQCSLVCPHAAIRAKQIEPAQLAKAPAAFKTVKSITKNEKKLEYKIQVYIEDCTGCGNCVHVCPAKTKALEFRPIEDERRTGEDENVEFFENLPDNIMDGTSIAQFKGVQFRKPMFEFSGACAGCGETPYVKLVSQLFGERMIVANATGCSSIYSGTFPTTPYCVNKEGQGPAWANSLFEDNAEYGLGMRLAVDSNRKQLRYTIDRLLTAGTDKVLEAALKKCLELWDRNGDDAQAAAKAVKNLLAGILKSAAAEKQSLLRKIAELQDYLVDKSVWCIGGDGWAYDIGYGGLDHVLATGKNVNVLVLDTELYSNTGGQASKATSLSAVAQFASAGKRTGKKDLGLMFMSYGYIYVASVALGANMNQVVKAFQEAEAYPGPSIIIAYSPCIMHGIDMGYSIAEEKRAVQSGYWPLYRYNPALAGEGKNPFVYESKDPTLSLQDFLAKEIRFSTLKLQFPDIADRLYEQAVDFKKGKHEYYKKLSELK